MPREDIGNDEIVRRIFQGAPEEKPSPGRLRSALEGLEMQMILDALDDARGNMALAASHLGITERIMGLRVRKYGIDPNRFKMRRDN